MGKSTILEKRAMLTLFFLVSKLNNNIEIVTKRILIQLVYKTYSVSFVLIFQKFSNIYNTEDF